jgi:hypothetical protein
MPKMPASTRGIFTSTRTPLAASNAIAIALVSLPITHYHTVSYVQIPTAEQYGIRRYPQYAAAVQSPSISYQIDLPAIAASGTRTVDLLHDLLQMSFHVAQVPALGWVAQG